MMNREPCFGERKVKWRFEPIEWGCEVLAQGEGVRGARFACPARDAP